jgi:hypothetical protein
VNTRSSLLWSFVGTLFLTGTMAGSQGLGVTRMNLPFMLGTMLTPNRDRAKLLGFGFHFMNGWLFGFLYAAAFESWRRSGWWRGHPPGNWSHPASWLCTTARGRRFLSWSRTASMALSWAPSTDCEQRPIRDGSGEASISTG